jgi:hypothetical protein
MAKATTAPSADSEQKYTRALSREQMQVVRVGLFRLVLCGHHPDLIR